MKLKTEEKINKIEEQIKKLKDQKRKTEEKLKKNVGTYLLNEWGIQDEELAKEMISRFKPEVENILNSDNSNSRNEVDHNE